MESIDEERNMAPGDKRQIFASQIGSYMVKIGLSGLGLWITDLEKLD
jgi:hypothetical protein